ncbi:hypothetical protein C1752_00874 [Acaryochloris thomasi RCC1774]|uniref:Uncharacterized protein n=1 Tax=Acaryochloris thomasi RCC1774 TaxID=1764569 RepID=A0A2W1JNT2_9CYAN|nr:hypothetical protein [Acaryochloris thomasi]PZD74949.1 hypothetical protein C1752_00874 [Acaryochloris thomasi RCC1774]
MSLADPTIDQLRSFYRVVRQAVLLSSYIAFTELTEDGNLFVYIGRYDEAESSIIVSITPNGEVNSQI